MDQNGAFSFHHSHSNWMTYGRDTTISRKKMLCAKKKGLAFMPFIIPRRSAEEFLASQKKTPPAVVPSDSGDDEKGCPAYPTLRKRKSSSKVGKGTY